MEILHGAFDRRLPIAIRLGGSTARMRLMFGHAPARRLQGAMTELQAGSDLLVQYRGDRMMRGAPDRRKPA